MHFEIVGPISHVEVIAMGTSIRGLRRLKRFYGDSRWRKIKGRAIVRFSDGRMFEVELHWYEAHGIGRKEFKIKRLIRSVT